MDLVTILSIAAPYILALIKSKVVPTLKRKMYERLDNRASKLIEDLAQNASKIATAETKNQQETFIEGTKRGLDTIRAIAEKLTKAADEIEKVLE